MPRVQDAIPSLDCRAWKGRSNPLLLSALRFAPESRGTRLQSFGRSFSEPNAINDAGWSVGYSYTQTTRMNEALLWSPTGKATNLNEILGTAWTDTHATGINDAGDIRRDWRIPLLNRVLSADARRRRNIRLARGRRTRQPPPGESGQLADGPATAGSLVSTSVNLAPHGREKSARRSQDASATKGIRQGRVCADRASRPSRR